jgi:hypothetical protein
MRGQQRGFHRWRSGGGFAAAHPQKATDNEYHFFAAETKKHNESTADWMQHSNIYAPFAFPTVSVNQMRHFNAGK